MVPAPGEVNGLTSTTSDYPNAELLAVPDVAQYRDVSATLSKNPVLAPASGEYEWPPLTHPELATTTIRLAAAPVAGTPGDDLYQVELDHAWLDVYGWQEPRPPELLQLRVERQNDGTLEASFDELAGAQRYNLYVGRLSTVRNGTYDHGVAAPAGPFCDTATLSAGSRVSTELSPGQQPAGDIYLLVTAHVIDVESPAGENSEGLETDRSQSTCR